MRIKGKLPLAQFVKVKVKAQKLWMRKKVTGQPGPLVTLVSNYGTPFISWFWDGDDGYDLTNPKMLLKKSPIPPTPVSSPALC